MKGFGAVIVEMVSSLLLFLSADRKKVTEFFWA